MSSRDFDDYTTISEHLTKKEKIIPLTDVQKKSLELYTAFYNFIYYWIRSRKRVRYHAKSVKNNNNNGMNVILFPGDILPEQPIELEKKYNYINKQTGKEPFQHTYKNEYSFTINFMTLDTCERSKLLNTCDLKNSFSIVFFYEYGYSSKIDVDCRGCFYFDSQDVLEYLISIIPHIDSFDKTQLENVVVPIIYFYIRNLPEELINIIREYLIDDEIEYDTSLSLDKSVYRFELDEFLDRFKLIGNTRRKE